MNGNKLCCHCFPGPRGAGGADTPAAGPKASRKPSRSTPAARVRCDAARGLAGGRSSLARGSRCPYLQQDPAPPCPCPLASPLRPPPTHCPVAAHHGPAALRPRPVRNRRRLPPRRRCRGFCQSQVSGGKRSQGDGPASCRRLRTSNPPSKHTRAPSHTNFLCYSLGFTGG